MQNLEYNNKNFTKIPQDYMHTKPRLQALNNFQRYKKEGPDPYKGSNQLQVEILNKKVPKGRPSFIWVLHTMIRLC